MHSCSFSGQQIAVLLYLQSANNVLIKAYPEKSPLLSLKVPTSLAMLIWMIESHLSSMLMWFPTLNCLLIAVKPWFFSCRVYTFALIIIRAGHFLDNCKHSQFTFKFMHKDVIGTVNFMLYERFSLIDIFYVQPLIDVPETNKFCLKTFTAIWFPFICIKLHFLSSVRVQVFLSSIKLT